MNEQVPEEIIERVKKAFTTTTDPQPELTPYAVAQMLRQLGRPVGDAEVLRVYEEVRRYRTEEDPEVIETRAFLRDHVMYELWKADVARGATLGGFFEWREQRS